MESDDTTYEEGTGADNEGVRHCSIRLVRLPELEAVSRTGATASSSTARLYPVKLFKASDMSGHRES